MNTSQLVAFLTNYPDCEVCKSDTDPHSKEEQIIPISGISVDFDADGELERVVIR